MAATKKVAFKSRAILPTERFQQHIGKSDVIFCVKICINHLIEKCKKFISVAL